MPRVYLCFLRLLVLFATLLPLAVHAATISSGEGQNPPTSLNDTLPAQTTAPHYQVTEPSYPGTSGVTHPLSGDSGEQTNHQASATTKNDKISVAYEQGNDNRKITIVLIIILGISLALNVYLATSLLNARKGSKRKIQKSQHSG